MRMPRMRLTVRGMMVAVAIVAGCGRTEIDDPLPSLHGTEPMTLYSLFPSTDPTLIPSVELAYRPAAKAEMFRDYPVLGRVEVVGPSRPKAMEALRAGIVAKLKESSGGDAFPACFEPRHGLLVIA